MTRRERWLPPRGPVPTTCGVDLQIHGRLLGRTDGTLTIGDGVRISSAPAPSHMVTGIDGVLTIGSGVRIGHGAAISCTDAVRIGDRSVLGAFVMVMDSDFHVAGDMDTPAPPEPIGIGSDVVIGHRVVVLPGSTIGDGARVLAGSVVAGAIAPFTTVAGNPAIDTARVSGSSTGGTIDEIIANVFQLATPLADDVRPEQVEGWDSLGMLRLLLALESAFDLVLDEQRLIAVTDVGDIKRLIASS